MTIELREITKAFHSRRSETLALDAVSLAVPAGEIGVVIGHSGSGKSTLLRIVAGLEPADAGAVVVNGHDVTHAPPGARDVAMVFQDNALYPHLRVGANVAFALRARKVPRDHVARQVAHALRMLGIEHLADRYPRELSGGEQQRVALARAVVRQPNGFLLDEPLSALDPELRVKARRDLRDLQRRLGTPMLYVTHDSVEAMTLADQLVVLNAGRVEQTGAPQAVHDRPASTYVARLVGLLPINLVAAEPFVAWWRAAFPDLALGEPTGTAATVGVRPEHVVVRAHGAGSGPDGAAAGWVTEVEPLGSDTVARIDLGPFELTARVARDHAIRPGEQVGVAVAAADLRWFGSDDRAIT